MSEWRKVEPDDELIGAINRNPLNVIVPVGHTSHEISCERCPAACCRIGTVMKLSREEVTFMEASGTKLEAAEGHHNYRLMTNCGNLAVTEAGVFRCTAHDNPARPSICQDFQVGSFSCLLIQRGRIGDSDVNVV